jgi:signal transduction histidine kinase/CheY-like chemotaxis protein
VSHPLTVVALDREHDLVLARQRARQVAGLLGLDGQDQVRVATAVSELARNALEYGGGGTVEYLLVDDGEPALLVRVSDDGAGIADLDSVLSGRFSSGNGMGVGLVGARRLMDRFEIESEPGSGTTVTVSKRLGQGAPTSQKARAELVATLQNEQLGGPFVELQRQNQELISALAELQARRDELSELNRELEETNRGVVALYAELDERAEDFRRSSESKSQFLSSLSHELRTPLTSMLALCELLMNRVDGPLTSEQEHQVQFIHTGAESLLVLVNDLLDLARVASGKTEVRPSEFEVEAFLGSLRGMFRPLQQKEAVALVFEPADGLPPIYSDESKLAQILRNLIANALKFTVEGEVRIACRFADGGATAVFTVADTGIGISGHDRVRIFDEFVQIDSALQAEVRGTGLGLAVCQRLAALLGGKLEVESEVGAGSTFTLEVPVVYRDPDEPGGPTATPVPEPAAEPLRGSESRWALVIDDDEVARYLVGRTVSALGYEVIEATGGEKGLSLARERRPDLIVLDLKMPGLDGFIVLQELKLDFRTAQIPVVIQTAKAVTTRDRNLLNGAVAIVDKREAGRGSLATAVEAIRDGG